LHWKHEKRSNCFELEDMEMYASRPMPSQALNFTPQRNINLATIPLAVDTTKQ